MELPRRSRHPACSLAGRLSCRTRSPSFSSSRRSSPAPLLPGPSLRPTRVPHRNSSIPSRLARLTRRGDPATGSSGQNAPSAPSTRLAFAIRSHQPVSSDRPLHRARRPSCATPSRRPPRSRLASLSNGPTRYVRPTEPSSAPHLIVVAHAGCPPGDRQTRPTAVSRSDPGRVCMLETGYHRP